MRRLAIILTVLVIVPIIEITALIVVGRRIGIGWTVLLLLASSAVGAWLLRREGARAWRIFQADLAAQRPPGNAATEGLLVLVGGILMVFPGFVTDAIGLLLILPPSRRLARVGLLTVLARRMSPQTRTSLFGPRRVRAHYGQPRPQPPPAPPPSGPTGQPPAGQNRPGEPPPTIEGEIIDPDR